MNHLYAKVKACDLHRVVGSKVHKEPQNLPELWSPFLQGVLTNLQRHINKNIQK